MNKFGLIDVEYEINEEGEVKTYPSVTMGDGSVAVSDVGIDGHGFAGIAFGEGEGKGVAVDIDVEPGTRLGSIKADFLLRFNNPRSIDVVIQALERAKVSLVVTDD